MDSARIRFLVDRYRDGTASDEEIKQLKLLVSDMRYRHLLETWMDDLWEEMGREVLSDMSPQRQQELLGRITGEGQRTWHMRKLWWYAAAVILFVSVGLIGFQYWQNAGNNALLALNSVDVPEILPGSNKAVLTLADGKKIILDDVAGGDALELGAHVTASMPASGTLVYKSERERRLPNPTEEVGFNTITTPVGGQYRVVLPDGSEVLLNAASELRYPVAFDADKRVVEFSGEGYFQVSGDKNRPFFVETLLDNDQHTIHVLGTEFNLNTYDQDHGITTSVITGSVGVKAERGVAPVILKPGQQSVLSEANGKSSLHVAQADLNAVTAWKDGLFVFNDEKLPELLKRVSRWYDVSFIYEDDVDEIRFQGNYFRDKGLLNLLENLEMTAKVEFLVENKQIAGDGGERRVYVKRQ